MRQYSHNTPRRRSFHACVPAQQTRRTQISYTCVVAAVSFHKLCRSEVPLKLLRSPTFLRRIRRSGPRTFSLRCFEATWTATFSQEDTVPKRMLLSWVRWYSFSFRLRRVRVTVSREWCNVCLAWSRQWSPQKLAQRVSHRPHT